MIENRINISDDELKEFGRIENLSKKADALLTHQKEHWDLVKLNYEALDQVQIKNFLFKDNLIISAQFNPSRIKSTAAKVDKESIERRACFLCSENLPFPQKGIKYIDKYQILINPYPIFKQHLTIPHLNHIPQSIEQAFDDLLTLSSDLKDNFFVFYNGPKCGASAPDHLHFQAGQKSSTPLETYYTSLKSKASFLYDAISLKVGIINREVFNLIFIQSNDRSEITDSFSKVLLKLKQLISYEEEPLLNIISFYENGIWDLLIFPRKLHRPKQFFFDNEDKLLISPASVDMLGLLITPRKEDFYKLTSKQIKDIYNQVEYNSILLNQLKNIF